MPVTNPFSFKYHHQDDRVPFSSEAAACFPVNTCYAQVLLVSHKRSADICPHLFYQNSLGNLFTFWDSTPRGSGSLNLGDCLAFVFLNKPQEWRWSFITVPAKPAALILPVCVPTPRNSEAAWSNLEKEEERQADGPLRRGNNCWRTENCWTKHCLIEYSLNHHVLKEDLGQMG